MDIDPLAGDSIPPRYAIESDEEEDEINPLHPQTSVTRTAVEVKILGSIPRGKTLLLVSGDFGKLWAKGSELGEQTGSVTANGVQVGLVFNPTWTSSTVIISETFTRLPLSAMHPYAKTVIDTLEPTSLSLIDTYGVPTYASDKSTSFYDSPLRYLTTSSELDTLNKDAQLFSPPNLIQSTAASFISLTSVREIPTTLILISSPHIPASPPKEISPSNFSTLSQDDIEWSPNQVNIAQNLAFKLLGEEINHPWTAPDKQNKEIPKKSTEIGEGGMYI